jgi:hypothetical protein
MGVFKTEIILGNPVNWGPIEVHFQGRRCFVGAMVLGDEPLLGAIPMEDMDLVIHPSHLKLIVNPDNPNIPGSLAK